MASARDLRLQVVLQAIDKAVAPLRGISAASSKTAQALKAARDELKGLNAQQGAVERFRALQGAMQGTSAQAKAVRARIEELRNAQAADAAEAKAHARELAAAEKSLARLNKTSEAQSTQLRTMRGELQRLGIRNVAADEQRLQGAIQSTTAAIARQKAQLEQLAATQRRMAGARAAYDRSQKTAGNLAGAGAATGAAGAAIGAPVALAVRDYSSFEDAMLGVARQVQGARDDAGKLTPIYAAIRQQVHELGREIPLTTNQIADMVTAGARMEVPTEALKDYTRTAAAMAIAFDAVPDEVAEAMGKVGKNFKIPITQIEGLADAINYLDDNAISKGSDIINVLNRISGVVSTVKMSAADAAALGSTLLTLGETRETAATAINAITQKFAAAEKGTKKFQAAMKEIGLKSSDVQKGMQTDAIGTFSKVANAIRKLPQDKRIGVMVELVGMEHSDTLAKLVDKPEELQRQIDLANSKQAKGSMGREFSARQDTLSAQWQMGRNRTYELTTALGESLRPALLNVMGTLGPIVERMSAWVRENPALVAGLMKGAAVLSLLLVGMGGFTLALAAVIGPFAVIRYGLAMFGIKGASALPVLRAITSGVFALGRAMLMNPIGLTITAIAVAALLIWRYWEPIKAFLLGLWDEVRAAFAGGLSGILGLLANFSPIGVLYRVIAAALNALGLNLPAKFTDLGGMLMAGLVNGITGALGIVRDTIMGAADSVVGWFKDKLGIRSPSRVFIDAGGEISAGAALGIESRQSLVRRAALGVAAAAASALPLTAGAVDGGLRIDSRPPLASAAGGAPMAAGGNTYNFTINALPGMDEQQLARLVAAELDRRDRAAAARARSSLRDTD